VISSCLRAALLLGCLALAAGQALAEDVRTRHRGMTLNANLEMARGKGLEDGVILIAHGLLAHNRMELVAALQRLFKERGLSTLAINFGSASTTATASTIAAACIRIAGATRSTSSMPGSAG
jgi:hypothetical protein